MLTIADDGVIEDFVTPEMIKENRQVKSSGPSAIGNTSGSFKFMQTCLKAADESLISKSYFKSYGSGNQKRTVVDLKSLDGNLGASNKLSQHLPFVLARWSAGDRHGKDNYVYDYNYSIATDKNGRIVYLSSTRNFPSNPSVDQIYASVVQKYGEPAKSQKSDNSSLIYANNGNEDLDEMYLSGSDIKDHLVFSIRPGILSVVAYNGAILQNLYQSNMDACANNINTYLKKMNEKDAKGNLDF